MRMEPRRKKAGIFVLFALAAVLLAGTAGAQSGANETTLVSRADGVDGVKGDRNSDGSSVSADGRYVAFESNAANLDAADADTSDDVFVRDLQENTTTLVSRASGENGVKGNGGSGEPSISADGRYVAFESNATNLHDDDTDTFSDIFVRDLQQNTTTLVSRADTAGGVKSNNNSFAPSISADGLRVAFTSFATNLHPDDADGYADIFVRDLQQNATILASRANGSTGANVNGDSFASDISADGNHVAFDHRNVLFDSNTFLHPDDQNFDEDVFVRGLVDDTTIIASRTDGANGAAAVGDAEEPSISADGRLVAFSSSAENLDAADTDSIADIFVRDTVDNETTLASRADGSSGAKSNNDSYEADISADGRLVSFNSNATNLHPGDITDGDDIYARDLTDGSTALVSRASGENGSKGDDESENPSVSADGRYVAFSSFATNLQPLDDPDTNDSSDVFLRDVLGPPPDTTPSDTTITAGPEGTTDNNQPTFEFESNEPGSTFECRLDSTDEADFQPCRSPFRTGRLAEGAHTFEVRAIDPANNTDQSPASRAFTVDTPDPRGCTITGTPDDDVLLGTSGRDVICGLSGDDTIRGLDGNDTLYGDAGDDRIFGGKGRDSLDARDGVEGNDLVDGRKGRDDCEADRDDEVRNCP